MKTLNVLFLALFIISQPLNAQQCGNTADAVGAAWDFYEENVPSVLPVIAISKLLDDIVQLYNNFPNNGPGKAGIRGLNIPTHQPQTGTAIGLGARVWLTPPSQDPHVEVTIKKTGGKAKTHIDICITGKNGIQEYVKSYTFEKNASNHSKTFVLKKVKNHVISVRINPKFGTNKFAYEISTSSQKPQEDTVAESTESSHPSGLEAGGAVSRAGSGDGIIRNTNSQPANESSHPSGLEAGGAVSRAGSGDGIIRNTNSQPANESDHPSGLEGGGAVSRAGSGDGIIRNTNSQPANESGHPSGLEAGGAVSRAGSGGGIIRNTDSHPGNITRGPEEHEIGGTYTMTMTNDKNHIVSSGSAIINQNETPWLLTLVPSNTNVRFIKIRGKFRNNIFRGKLEDDPAKKIVLNFNRTTNTFTGKIKELLPNASFKSIKMKLVKL